ncbi:hypothetical protein [Spiroplasma taiwanense]|uniref:Uncharacterized protein n=1 Tax=Spiroplasma taiwanense CT-1 TaxID=1276220 RepID=S5LWT0_9MOLU|nr:hypothetical protein [Spiroplasma taiwanense]AGR41096.1 hypothetical protein STAIW_v1c04500 [Spiroplasma taiwanense CT-1]
MINKIINKTFIKLNKKAKLKLLNAHGNYRKTLKHKVQNQKMHKINFKVKKNIQKSYGIARQNWTFF